MKNILVVDDAEKKVKKLRELLGELDPAGEKYNLVVPITPRPNSEGAYDDKGTIYSFLDTQGLNDISVIFQEHNLSNVKGHELVPVYREREYRGPIISFTASDWSWYQKLSFASTDLALGFTAVFPWGDKFKEEQLEFLRENLP